MRVLLTIILYIFTGSLYAQDTLFLRSMYPFTAKVLEVADDTVTIQKPGGTNAQKERIKKIELKLIKYKGGYIERYNPNSSYIYGDKIQFTNSKTINCDVIEVSEGDSVVVDIYKANGFKTISFDSIATITFRYGLKQSFHELIDKSGKEISEPAVTGGNNDIGSELDKSKGAANNVAISKLFNKLTDTSSKAALKYQSVNQEFNDAKGNIESIKTLFDRVISDQSFKGDKNDSVLSEIILERCRLFEETYFSGKKENEMPVGKGVLYTPNGEILSGEFVNGKLSGIGKITRNSGIERREGKFSNGELNGEGIITEPKKVIKGMFIGNQLSGRGEISFSNGAWEKGIYSKSRLEGEGERHLKDSNFYKGNFKSARYNGPGVYRWADKDVTYEGNFTDGKLDGEGVLKLPGGITLTGKWKNNCPDGEINIRMPNGENGEFHTALWIVNNCKIGTRKIKNKRIKFDESLLFLTMTGL